MKTRNEARVRLSLWAWALLLLYYVIPPFSLSVQANVQNKWITMRGSCKCNCTSCLPTCRNNRSGKRQNMWFMRSWHIYVSKNIKLIPHVLVSSGISLLSAYGHKTTERNSLLELIHHAKYKLEWLVNVNEYLRHENPFPEFCLRCVAKFLNHISYSNSGAPLTFVIADDPHKSLLKLSTNIVSLRALPAGMSGTQ